MHYVCCRSFLSVCSFTTDICTVGIFIEARLLNLNRCRGSKVHVQLLIVFTTHNSRSKHVPRNWRVCVCLCECVCCACVCVCVCVCVCENNEVMKNKSGSI